MGYGGGLLHSHVQTYPTGSEQQQVTCYHYKDSNNDWIVKKPRKEEASSNNETEIEFVKNNDIVRLVHLSTNRNLHSHVVDAPVTKSQYEVSGYGNDTIGDDNDHWYIEVVNDILYGKNDDKIRSLTNEFKFKNN